MMEEAYEYMSWWPFHERYLLSCKQACMLKQKSFTSSEKGESTSAPSSKRRLSQSVSCAMSSDV
jgi:hypothetical protein